MMADEMNNSLVNLGNLSKPADTLIKKVSDAVGGIFAPYQVKRMAKAEAAASLIKADAEIKVTDLHRRAMHRFIQEEATKQENIESITSQAIPNLEQNAEPEKMDNDWVTNFFDKSRIVSDEEMQRLWAKVLAGEANSPGTYSKRTVNFLGDLDKNDADMFRKLCAFGWQIGNIVPLVFDAKDEIYAKNGLNFNTLSHLDSIGLIQFNTIAGFRRIGLPKRFMLFYYGSPFPMEMEKDAENELEIGHVLLTQTGQELAPLCGSKPIDGLLEYARTKWAVHVPKQAAEQCAPADPQPASRPADS